MSMWIMQLSHFTCICIASWIRSGSLMSLISYLSQQNIHTIQGCHRVLVSTQIAQIVFKYIPLISRYVISDHLMLWIPQASLAALMARTIWIFRFSLSCNIQLMKNFFQSHFKLETRVLSYFKEIYCLLISPWKACRGWFFQSHSSWWFGPTGWWQTQDPQSHSLPELNKFQRLSLICGTSYLWH